MPQAAHSHAFGSRGTNLLAERLTDVYDALVAAGAGKVNLADFPPPMLGDFERQPSDDDLNMLTVRRSVFEWVLRDRALSREGVSIRTGATVRGLVTEGDRVTGVRLDDGTELAADLVLDTSGRKTAAAQWLGSAGLVTSVTEVNDEATVDLMLDLHKGIQAGHGLGDVLLEARRAARSDAVSHATTVSFAAFGV